MSTTEYFMPTINLFGPGSVNEVGNRIKMLSGKRVLIVTDEFLGKAGMADNVKKIIEDAGLEAVIFDGAQPNPTDLNVQAGLSVFKKEKCDSLVSLGGGSSHDCAKGVGLLAANGGKIQAVSYTHLTLPT